MGDGHLKPEARNPKPETRNLKPEARNPKPETRNLKPATRQELRYSYQQVFIASDLARRRLPMIRAHSTQEGPLVWLTACAHGDEVGGIAVIHEVFRRLRKNPLLRGAVHAFPLMNPFAFELGTRHFPLGNEDLNRCFPGSATGSLASRIAWRVFESIRSSAPTVVLDLHNDWTNSIPYSIVDPPPPQATGREAYQRCQELAPKLGLVVVVERADAEDALGWQQTLSASLIARGIPALTIELGEARVINEANVEVGVSVVFNLLEELEMLGPRPKPFQHPSTALFGRRLLYYSDQPCPSSSGLVRFHVRPGEAVRKGRVLARTFNAFGKMLERLRAPQDGIVLGHSDSSVALPGIPILGFAIPHLEPATQEQAESRVELVEEAVPASELPVDPVDGP
ncbi:MAG: succinylglutamate desuccinylase/aspartoacylase family protein [Myxococcota bacterium]|jgi:predicted deacylase|nr:succinylglutamate desuccinylase/aspartoacylase family protein [Myxococcota bacterium]